MAAILWKNEYRRYNRPQTICLIIEELQDALKEKDAIEIDLNKEFTNKKTLNEKLEKIDETIHTLRYFGEAAIDKAKGMRNTNLGNWKNKRRITKESR